VYNAPIGLIDVLLGLLVILIIIIIGNSKRSKLGDAPHAIYYMRNIYFKLLFASVFGAIYIYYYGGADTTAYWRGAEKLNNLLWQSPTDYFAEMISEPIAENIVLRFNSTTGYPPIWIYADDGSFFVSKILSVFMIFCGQSYLVLTLVMGYVTAIASWKVFELVRSYKITTDWFAALSILFIPSVGFWCAGISKDTIVLVSVFYLLHHLFGIANKTVKSRGRSLLLVLLFGWILYSTRSFMLFTVAAPIALALSTRLAKQYKESAVLKNILRFFILFIGFGGFLIFLRYQGEVFAKTTNEYLTEAAIQQDDFANNKSYGDKRYDLEITDYSPFGMLKVAPRAILTAFYRPGIWEARSPLLLISGLETTLFIYLTLIFIFKGNLARKIRVIRNNELLIFSILFALILGFFAGFTSGLFGVLVRFKAPLLPFLLIVLTTSSAKTKIETEEKELETGNS